MSSTAKRQASGSRLQAKSLKRAPSGSKKKGLGATPDASVGGSSHSSTSSTGQDKRQEECFLDEVLRGEDVDALRIKEENLKTVPRPPCSERPHRTRRVIVKKIQPLSADKEIPQPMHKRVAVLHPLPRGTTVGTSKPLGSTEAGPRFDKQGTFLSHSVLGPTRDYASQLKNTGEVGSVTQFSGNPPIFKPDEIRSPRDRSMSYAKTIVPRERHALDYWNKSMEMRKSQQKYLASEVGSPPEKLVMNQADGFRAVQEQRTLIDRAIPSVDYGKGYRVGSEFWNQQVRIGNDITGIDITLTQSEHGLPPEFEFVGVPSMVRKEKGMPMADQERNDPVHYTWEQSSYLATRTKELADILDNIEPFRPEISELQVIGHQPGTEVGEGGPSRTRLRTDSLDSLGETNSLSSLEHDSQDDLAHNLLDLPGPDVDSQPIIGPALRVGGQLLKWLGPPPSTSASGQPISKLSLQGRATQSESALKLTSGAQLTSTASLMHLPSPVASQLQLQFQQEYINKQPIELRVNFEGKPNTVVSSFLEMENCGTAAVYFSWQLLPKPNPLDTVQAGQTQRFYFDSKGGVLLPGHRLEFPFIFKSPNAGIFSESWSLQTGPVLNRGRPITVTLKGVAFQEDLTISKRQQLEELLNHRVAETAARRIVNQLVKSIKTPPHSPEPITTTVLEEDVFRMKNPGVYYRYNTVQQLKTLHLSVFCPELVPDPEPVQETTVKSGKKGDEKSAGKGKDKGGKEKEKKPAVQKVKEEQAETPQSATAYI